MMKLHGSDVIQMPDKSEGAAAELVVPHFDLVVVAAANQQMPVLKSKRVTNCSPKEYRSLKRLGGN